MIRDLIGLIVALCIACYFMNNKVDDSRVKKWWDDDNDK